MVVVERQGDGTARRHIDVLNGIGDDAIGDFFVDYVVHLPTDGAEVRLAVHLQQQHSTHKLCTDLHILVDIGQRELVVDHLTAHFFHIVLHDPIQIVAGIGSEGHLDGIANGNGDRKFYRIIAVRVGFKL